MRASASMLDASALLAFLFDEPGCERVALALGQPAYMSAVNWCEVLTKLLDSGWLANAKAVKKLQLVQHYIVILPFDELAARAAAALRQATRKAGLSLGDRACLAMGRIRKVLVLTTETIWVELNLGIEVEAVRKPTPKPGRRGTEE